MSESSFWRTLKKLETWGQIKLEANSHGTVVSICNWETYQGDETCERTAGDTAGDTASGQQADSKRTASGQQADSKRTLEENERIKELENVRREETNGVLVIDPPDGVLDCPRFKVEWRKWITYLASRGETAKIEMMAQTNTMGVLQSWGLDAALDTLRMARVNGWVTLNPQQSAKPKEIMRF